jgi:hypothetical protein
MRSSFVSGALVATAALAAVTALTATACSITAKTQPEFVDPGQAPKTSSKTWDGEEIVVNNAGVNPMLGTGGVTITFDENATTITAKADFVARADTEAEAKLSIADAIATFRIEESAGRTSILCGNGGAHGSSSAAASGCKRITITLPAGSAQKPLKLTVGTGMGDIRFTGAPVVSSLLVDNNGTGGEVDVAANPVKGARIVVTGEDNVTVRLPRAFAADKVVFTFPVDSSATVDENAARVNVADFPGMKNGEAFGTVGSGASELNVQTKGPFSDDGINIRAF